MFCPLCSGSDFLPVITRERATVSCNLLYDSPESARNAPRGKLTIVLCRSCGFVFNRTFDLAKVPYGPGYDNDQTQSAIFQQHMMSMADRVRRAVDPLRVIEIGCGQGQFLKLLIRDGDKALGFDPSYSGSGMHGCEIRREFFGPKTALNGFTPNSVVSRHVIEHVPEPREMVQSMRDALPDRIGVFFETPDVNWILRNHAFWDFCYEHCSYFTPQTLSYLFSSCGFTPLEVAHVFSGQYLWIESQTSSCFASEPETDECLARSFAEAFRAYQSKWRDAMRGNRVAVWGSATKGVTFAHDIDPSGELIHCMIDINPKKQGKSLPLSGHRVVSPESALSEGIELIIVSNPNYVDEIRQVVASRAEVMCL